MAFHALLCVRDEEDIICQSLAHLLLWADFIHVFDTGSSDETWNIIRDFAATEGRIIPHLYEKVWFNDAVTRAWLFEISRNTMRDGDWVGRVDADEIYHELPPDFIKHQVKLGETALYFQRFEFCLIDKEAQAWFSSGENRSDPIEIRRRWYKISTYSEPRFFRYRSTMQWPSNASFPCHAGFVSQARIPIRHYPHRDPVQMHNKCIVRSAMMRDARNSKVWQSKSTHHWQVVDWRSLLVSTEDHDLHYWPPGGGLPKLTTVNHLPGALKRAIQRLVHTRPSLTVLDMIRKRQHTVHRPYPLDTAVEADITRRVREGLREDNFGQATME